MTRSRGMFLTWTIGVVCALAAPGFEARAGAALEVYENPRAVVADGRTYLFATLKDPLESPVVCLREDDGGGWERLAEFRADYACAAAARGRLYLFLAESVIELSAADCKKTAEAPWPFASWPAQTVVAAGDELIAFGVENKRLHSATLALVQDPLAGRWSYREVVVEGQGECVQARAAVVGDRLWLFWSVEDPAREAETLWAAELVEGKPVRSTKLDTVKGRAEFAAVAFEGEPMVIYAGLPERLADPSFLRFRKRRKDRWLSAERAREVTNPFDERSLTVDAVARGKIVRVFLGTDYRVLGTTYDGEKWAPARAVLSDPRVDWIIEHLHLILAVVAAAFVVVLASVIRSRFQPRRAIIGGVEYPFAAWWQRGGAYLVDLCISFLAVLVIHALSGRSPTAASWPVAMFVFEIIYFTASEARSGKTPGKRLFGIMTVSRNGGYPTWSQAALRNLPRAVLDSLSMMFVGAFIAIITISNTKSSQRIGDFAAGTHVVRDHHRK